MVAEPPAVNGGGVSRGTITLNREAPEGGAQVQLSSSNAAAQVPATVAIPSGARSVTFAVATRSVPQDVNADIVGSVSGRTTLGVYALLPTSFTWISEPGDPIWRGGYGRHTPDNASFVARCERDELMVQIDSRVTLHSSIRLSAPRGTPLRPGTYEGATRTAFRGAGEPGLDIGINATGSNTVRGRFVVSEADFGASGEVRRFMATFEQYCGNSTTAVTGELRLTGPFPMPPFPVSCLR